MPRSTVTSEQVRRPDVAGGCMVVEGFQGPVHVCEAGAWIGNIATDQHGTSYGQVILHDRNRMAPGCP